MSEAALVITGHKRLRNRGAWIVKTTGVSVAGIPDTLYCYRGTFGAIEWKHGRNQPTPRQRHQLDLIRRAGGHTTIARHPDDADRALDLIDRQLDTQPQVQERP